MSLARSSSVSCLSISHSSIVVVFHIKPHTDRTNTMRRANSVIELTPTAANR